MAYIQKHKIMTGVFIVTIEEEKLNLLCGSPADVSKHLFKLGFIAPTELNGVPFEKGPNAILLSDLPMQNGFFSNLTEFPVLHMLYKQGMIIPNHPNNSGTKPLLIGKSSQLTAQMNYIFRGNYGLTTWEEYQEAGMTRPFFEMNDKFKKKFAFGNYVPTEKLLDSIAFDENTVKVREGITLNRISENVFEISYKGEKELVDLNLQPGDEYEVSYNIYPNILSDAYFSVINSGSGDGWGPDDPCFSSLIRVNEQTFLVDSGPNITNILKQFDLTPKELSGIFLTHSHDDHFAGLPALAMAMGDEKLPFYATSLVRTAAMKKLEALLDGDKDFFFEHFEPVDLKYDEWNQLPDIEVKPQNSPHPIETSIFTFRVFNGNTFKTVGHFADITSFKVLENFIEKEPGSGEGISQEYYDSVKRIYAEPLDVKKVDVGGGMIHGEASDFNEDESKSLILAHKPEPFSEDELKIGENEIFGHEIILIHNKP